MPEKSLPVFSHGILFMLLAVLSFGLLNVIVKNMPGIPVHEVIFFRSAFSLIVTSILIRTRGLSPWGINRKWLLIRGILGTLAIGVFFISLHHIPLASLATLQYMAPLFTALAGIFLLREKVKLLQWLMLGTALIGVILTRGFETTIPILYFILGLLSAVFSGTVYAVVRKLSRTDHPLVIIFWFPLIAAPISGVFCLFRWVPPSINEWLMLILIGILTQIAQMFLSWALKMENALRITSTMFLGTIVAFSFSICMFGETYSPINILGIVVIIISVLGNVLFSHRQ